MDTIYIPNNKIKKYPLFVDVSLESHIYDYNDKEILKIFKYCSQNKLKTLKEIEKAEKLFNLVPELLKFKKYVMNEDGIIGILLDKGYKTTLSKLNLENTSLADLIEIYKNIGKVLEKLQILREKEKILIDFFIGDLHEGNILVDLDSKKIQIIDLDSCKIGANYASYAKYLASPVLRRKDLVNKYPQEENNISNNHNTDLYCYMVMIMQNFFGRCITFSKEESFYSTINYLKDYEGLPINLYKALNKLYKEEDNINPYPYLDDLKIMLERKLKL